MSMPMSTSSSRPRTRVGVWLIGARGSVATTVVAGCAAVTAGLHPPTGMVTETPPFTDCGLPPLSALVFGGHDTVDCPLPKRAEALTAGRRAAARPPLGRRRRTGRRRPGDHGPAAPLPATPANDRTSSIAAFAADIQDFARRHGLARTVVVNVASTEPAPDRTPHCPPSSLYAAAALRAGCPYVNFTPSTGLHHPALAHDAATQRTALRGPGRQDRPDAAPVGARPDVRAARPGGPRLVGHQPARRRETERPSPTRPPRRRRTPARNASSPTPSVRHRRARSTSTTSRPSATGRPPGTTSPSTASSAPA